MSSRVRVFVYGTLKQGFPNFGVNAGERMGDEFITCEALPLYVVSLPTENRAPWLMNLPGEGMRVRGQVYEVDAAALDAMDTLELVGHPNGYVRSEVELVAHEGGDERFTAYVYLKPPEQLVRCLTREGPFEAYTEALAVGYWLNE
ncbi:gamma-glutamylcyclotransferase family protein [Hydrogenophaga sp. 5NK40-0174]|uniref:gamma-glutamylcyclotransferase family protein n=1 Tax=Hydrogenophaga sp. 5NK40-0174 TaxID=3127649 RepID=UPI003106147F